MQQNLANLYFHVIDAWRGLQLICINIQSDLIQFLPCRNLALESRRFSQSGLPLTVLQFWLDILSADVRHHMSCLCQLTRLSQFVLEVDFCKGVGPEFSTNVLVPSFNPTGNPEQETPTLQGLTGGQGAGARHADQYDTIFLFVVITVLVVMVLHDSFVLQQTISRSLNGGSGPFGQV